jgi:hypothetical protein
LTFSLFPANSVVAQTNVSLFTLDSTPFGIPYNEWTAKWWEWLISIPLSQNPAADNTGEFCAKNQNQTDPVWFLVGTFQGRTERTCEIPAGKGLLFPVLNLECSFAEYTNLKTDSELSQCAKEAVDKVTFVQASVLQPLSTGTHTINFKGAVVDVPTTGIASITNDVTYHLTVVAVPEGANQTQSVPLQE